MDFHRTGNAMARVLVQYIPDPHKVMRIVRAERGPICLHTVRQMRASFVGRREKPIQHSHAPVNLDHAAVECGSRALLEALYRSHPYVFDAAQRQGRLAVRP